MSWPWPAPDLVVCDIRMPGLDGYGVLARFHQSPHPAGVPFLFLTARIERADQCQGMALGADDYLTKPFAEADLLSAISGRRSRCHQFRAAYDLRGEGLPEFLADARAVGYLEHLTTDRKTCLVRKKQDIHREGDEPTRRYLVNGRYAQACGATGFTLTETRDADRVIREVRAHKGPVVGCHEPRYFRQRPARYWAHRLINVSFST